ncbi:hypothetical protein D3C72_1880840 [compost metagenome]
MQSARPWSSKARLAHESPLACLSFIYAVTSSLYHASGCLLISVMPLPAASVAAGLVFQVRADSLQLSFPTLYTLTVTALPLAAVPSDAAP